MKLYRFVYWALLICSLLFGLYSGNRFSWTVFLTLALVLLAALGVNLWTFFSFSYVQELSAEEEEKGRTVELHIGIYNDKPFPFTRMKATVEAPDPAENQTLAIDLAPKASCAFDLQLSLPRRGEFLAGMTRLDLQDVFGLLPMRFDLRRLPYYRQKPILALPRMGDFALPFTGAAQSVGSGRAAAGAGQEEYAYLRNWQAGDRLSRIHWAASAKTRALFSRQYENPAGESCLIYLDCHTLSDELSDRLTECAATLLCAHLSRGDSVRLLAGGETEQPERAFTTAQLPALRRWLALLKFDEKAGNARGLRDILIGEQYGRVYVLGGAFDPAVAHALDGSRFFWRYWLAGPLPEELTGRYQGCLASLGRQDVSEFLYQHLVDGV